MGSSPLEKPLSASVTAIIPALRRPDLTERCLRSLAALNRVSGGLEVVIVENQAQQETIFRLETLPAPVPFPVRQILLEQNLGTTDSINRALAETASEFVLLLNNDVELDPAFVSALSQKLQGDLQFGFATGKLLNARERTQLDGAGDALLLGGGAYRLGHQDPDAGQFGRNQEVFAGCGAATLYRRSALEDVGGLDGDFFAYLDDIDLAFRLQLRGWRGVYEPAAVAYHIGSATLGEPMHPNIARWMTRNQFLLLFKNYPPGVALRLLPRIAVYQFLWFLMLTRSGKITAYLKGLFDVLRLLPRFLSKRRHVQSQRKLTNPELMQQLRNSEAQIYSWHAGGDTQGRSRLLDIYFGVFGKP